MRLNKLAKAQREKLNISQARLARAMGWSSPQYVSNFEREYSTIPLKRVPKLCKALKIPLAQARKVLLDDYSDRLSEVFK